MKQTLAIAALVLFATLLLDHAIQSLRRCFRPPVHYRRRPIAIAPAATDTPTFRPAPASHGRRKPDWVRAEVLRLKAVIGTITIRKLTDTFNHLHGDRATVGRSFVAELIKARAYEIACLRRDLRNRPPHPYPVNTVWAMDFTFQADTEGKSHVAFGLIDHGSRVLLRLQRLSRRCAWTVLGHLCLAIAEFGKPRAVRSDNEPVFRSRLLRGALRAFGIRQQFSQPYCPWQNGRIERLFRTLKEVLRKAVLPDASALDTALFEFRLFYNHVRSHQNLGGRTPAEAWQADESSVTRKPAREPPKLVSAVGGLMVGYYLRR